jgi:predicted NodU family carbamoyl transferase
MRLRFRDLTIKKMNVQCSMAMSRSSTTVCIFSIASVVALFGTDTSDIREVDYFNYCSGLTMTNGRVDELFGGPARSPDTALTQREMDRAASILAATEEVVLRLTRSIVEQTGSANLCLAGGVALNCVANGKVMRDGKFHL